MSTSTTIPFYSSFRLFIYENGSTFITDDFGNCIEVMYEMLWQAGCYVHN